MTMEVINALSAEEKTKLFKVWACIAASTYHKKYKYEYRSQVQKWCEFLGYQVGTDEAADAMLSATAITARAYRAHLEGIPGQRSRDGDTERSEKSAPATVRKKMAVLRSIYRDLQEEGLISHNPFLARLIPSVDYQKRPTEMLPFSKVWEIITAPGSPKHLSNHRYPANCDRVIRDRAMLAMLFAGALRRSEVTKIRVGGVRRTEEGTTYLLLRDTKRHGDTTQVIADWASEFVWAWYDRRKAERASDNDFFICPLWRHGTTHRAGEVDGTSVYMWLKEYLALAGLDPNKYSPHSARTTAVTRLLDQGTPYNLVKDYSRHSTVLMVEKYDKRRTEIDDCAGSTLVFPRKTGS